MSVWPTPFAMPETVRQRQAQTPRVAYPRSWFFDFAAGDFPVDATGRVPETDGMQAWAQAAVKTLLVQRAAHPIYSRRFGVDLDGVLRQTARPVQEAMLRRDITAALVADPRTRAVRDFRFTWAGNTLTVAFVLEPTAGVSAPVDVRVTW